MEKKRVEIETPTLVYGKGISIVPIVEVSAYGWGSACGTTFFGNKKPLYVLVLTPNLKTRAFDINGEETTLEQIKSKTPELEAELSRLKV